MVTKEQCLINQALEEIDYGRNEGLIQNVITSFNVSKKYVSEKIFINNEQGLNTALQGMPPASIVYAVLGEGNEFRIDDPFFIVTGDEIKSIDGYDLRRMIQPADTKEMISRNIFNELSDTDIFDAFDAFVQANYPQQYNQIETGNLYDMGFRNGYSILDVDWNQLVEKLMHFQPQLDEGRVLEMTDEELRKMVAEGAKRVYEEIKIKEKNKGKFNATKARTGKSTEELTHSKNPLTRKRAQFALNAAKWNHK